MKLEDVRPHDCLAQAQRLLAEVDLIRAELGRAEDTRPLLSVAGARPRACYAVALATWHRVDRLAAELGVASARFAHAAPPPPAIVPGHVHQVIDAALARVDAIKQHLQITETVAPPAVVPDQEPSAVLATLVQVNRQLTRALEGPVTPGDVYGVVARAASYAARLGGVAALAPFARGRKPADCYRALAACLTPTAAAAARHAGPALTLGAAPPEVVPGDVYDLAWLVLGELAFVHARTADAAPVSALEPMAAGHRLPAHVDQLARTLAAQLAVIG